MVVLDVESVKVLIVYLVGINVGYFICIDIDFDSGLVEWLESIGLLCVDVFIIMVCGELLVILFGVFVLFVIVI